MSLMKKIFNTEDIDLKIGIGVCISLIMIFVLSFLAVVLSKFGFITLLITLFITLIIPFIAYAVGSIFCYIVDKLS